jgi:peptidyl-prolyl cis-trans isomerase A (cyclophilin A)
MGRIVCKLFDRQAPKTVANFVGLAEGTKEFIDISTGQKAKRRFYDGLIFHRVIPNFMIQGGDPMGRGMGGPGYQFEDEIAPGLTFDQTGRLAMANAGPNTNGSQFFITVAPTPWLNGHYSLFGQVVEGQDVANRIANVPRNAQDKPLKDVVMNKVTIEKVVPVQNEKQTGKISGKKILFVIAPQDFRDEEYFTTKDILTKEGASVVTASLKTGELTGMLGGKAKSDLLIDTAQTKEYDAVAFIGGSGASILFENPKAQGLARDAASQGKIVSAICIAPAILANAGVLKDKNATSFPDVKNILVDKGAKFSDQPVVQDGNIITANGPDAAKAFGIALLGALEKGR